MLEYLTKLAVCVLCVCVRARMREREKETDTETEINYNSLAARNRCPKFFKKEIEGLIKTSRTYT